MASEWKVIGTVQLQPHHHPSRTRHTINGASFPPFIGLEIATSGSDAGFYLLHICAEGPGADTWHETLDDAFYQAEFEFGVQESEWQMESKEPFHNR
jgi:hypothetical protein